MCSSQRSIWMWTLVPSQNTFIPLSKRLSSSRNNIKIEIYARRREKNPRLSLVILWHNSNLYLPNSKHLIRFLCGSSDHFSKSSTGVSFFHSFVHNNFGIRERMKRIMERMKRNHYDNSKTIISDRLFVWFHVHTLKR